MYNINNLPDEVIVQIFQNLSPQMLKSCSLVCKKWDDVIGISKELMSKFKLVLLDDHESYEEVNEIERNHQNIIIQRLCARSLDAISTFNLSELRIHRIEDLKLSDLVKAFQSSPMLRVFSSWEIKFEDDVPDIQHFQRIKMNLETILCVAEIFRIFDCSTLKSVRLFWNHEMSLEQKLLAYELLNKQKNLRTFTLSEYPIDNFFHSPEIFLKFKFHLKSFTYFSAGASLINYKNMIQFLDSQKASLVKLDLEIQPRDMLIIETIQMYVFEHMSNLKDLRLDLSIREEGNTEWISDMEDQLKLTEITKNIERLSYKGPQKSTYKCKQIINLFPNIKHLNFGSNEIKAFRVLKHVSRNLVNLESLEFLSFHDQIGYSYSTTFPNLKKFESFGIVNEMDFSSFILRHSNTLEWIKINDVEEMTELTANAIMECDNLEYLEFGSYEDDLLYIMRLFPELSSRTKPLTFIHDYSSRKTFKLPEDQIFWDEILLENEFEDDLEADEDMTSEIDGMETDNDSDDDIGPPPSKIRKLMKTIWNGISKIFH